MKQTIIKVSILVFLITNALFWGLFPHSYHCELVSVISELVSVDIECPEHKIHLLMGLLFYIASVYFVQKDSLEL